MHQAQAMPEEIKQRIQEELRQLENELRTEIPHDLKIAVAMGDLSENAEYTAARNRQDYVRARIANLRKRLPDISMIDLSRLPHDRVDTARPLQSTNSIPGMS